MVTSAARYTVSHTIGCKGMGMHANMTDWTQPGWTRAGIALSLGAESHGNIHAAVLD